MQAGSAASRSAPGGRPYTPRVDTTLQDPLVGRELDGRYLVRSRIARGGMATVYLAVDSRLDREVALKVMHAHLADDEQFTVRFIREARSAARLSHPNVVQVFDQGSDGDLLYLAMEHLRGRTLREVLAERGVLTPRETLTVLEPVLDALSAAHRIGIVHRDIKPENVILTDEGRVKVADFGLARAATANTSTVGVLMGTVAYLAPELVVRGVADTRSDVYAAGIMFFEMLTGRQPFTGEVPIQVAYQHVNEAVPAPSSVAPGIPAALDAVVAAATAREPDDRPSDAEDLLTAVRAAHGRLTPEELDARPEAPSGAAVAESGGSATEIVGAPRPAPQRTRALPELAAGLPPPPPAGPATPARGRPGTPLGTPLGLPPDLPPGREHGLEPDAEDDALAAMLRRRRTIGLTALLTVLGLALALAVTAWYFASGPGAYKATPKVAGLAVAEARDQLAKQGLRSAQEDVFDATVASGVVVGTDPAAGRDVRKDGTVTLKVSKGPEFVKVPAVVGQQESAARAALTTAHLVEGTRAEQYSDEPRGEVLAVAPDPGQQVRNGSAVAVTVSKGPKPVQVPDLVGRRRGEAEAILKELRLGVLLGPSRNDDAPAGTVIEQKPRDTTLVPGQGQVTLVLSKGPVLVQVPNVIGKQFAEAESLLNQAGFSVERRSVFGGFFGTVRFQTPGGGRMAPKGSTVVVTLV
jgi:eukaryotic-like serine/threonine-protein kinase